MLLRRLALARAQIELAEAEVAVGDERAHAAAVSGHQSELFIGNNRARKPLIAANRFMT